MMAVSHAVPRMAYGRLVYLSCGGPIAPIQQGSQPWSSSAGGRADTQHPSTADHKLTPCE